MKEEDIRKREVFSRYLELVKEDVETFFDFSSFVACPCPACLSVDCDQAFKKSGFTYVTCSQCSTLFVSPRPSYVTLGEFYKDSPSTRFWVDEFFKPVAEARRAKIFRPRAEYVASLVDRKSNLSIAEVGAGFGLFLDELRSLVPDNTFMAVEPSSSMSALCQQKGLPVIQKCLEDLDQSNQFDVIAAFEMLEHVHDPQAFMQKIYELLKDDGIFVASTLNGKGFDIQLLWEHSKSIFPPPHLNFFNYESIVVMCESLGFSILELSTPGVLDWDIVEGMIKNEGVDCGRFWNDLAYSSSSETKRALQEFITQHNLSSHMRIVVQKKS